MSKEIWIDERLNQLADLVASNIQAQARHEENMQRIDQRIERMFEAQERHQEGIQRHEENLQRIERLVESNARVIQALADASAEARSERDELFKRMDQQQAEIVGLRIETARLLDILLNQKNQEDNQN